MITLSHPGGGNWRNSVGFDVSLFSLFCQSERQAMNPQLGRRIIGLPEVAIYAAAAGRVDDATIPLFPHDVPRGPRHFVRAS